MPPARSRPHALRFFAQAAFCSVTIVFSSLEMVVSERAGAHLPAYQAARFRVAGTDGVLAGTMGDLRAAMQTGGKRSR
jgi:hypothetical protein